MRVCVCVCVLVVGMEGAERVAENECKPFHTESVTMNHPLMGKIPKNMNEEEGGRR